MDEQEITQRVSKCVATALGRDEEECTVDKVLSRDLEAESIDYLDITFQLEKEFGITIQKDELFPQKIFQDERLVKDGVVTEEGLKFLGEAPYLKLLGVLVMLTALMSGVIDFAFKAEAAARYRDSESLVTFFATFYAAVGVLGFLLQSLLGRRILQRYGIGTTIAILPALIAMFGTVGSIATQLWSMVMLRGSHAIFVTSLFRSAFELLYTPLPPRLRMGWTRPSH